MLTKCTCSRKLLQEVINQKTHHDRRNLWSDIRFDNSEVPKKIKKGRTTDKENTYRYLQAISKSEELVDPKFANLMNRIY